MSTPAPSEVPEGRGAAGARGGPGGRGPQAPARSPDAVSGPGAALQPSFCRTPQPSRPPRRVPRRARPASAAPARERASPRPLSARGGQSGVCGGPGGWTRRAPREPIPDGQAPDPRWPDGTAGPAPGAQAASTESPGEVPAPAGIGHMDRPRPRVAPGARRGRPRPPG